MVQRVATHVDLKVADEVWIAAALLHRAHPDREDFSVQEIIERARAERLTARLRPGVAVHIYTHAVANLPPTTGRYRLLFATGKTTRRLFRNGDKTHPGRTGKITPAAEDIPARYRPLLDWYSKEYSPAPTENWLGGIFEMIGAGAREFAGIDPDKYVRELREGWE